MCPQPDAQSNAFVASDYLDVVLAVLYEHRNAVRHAVSIPRVLSSRALGLVFVN
jgi:hypothetical protein